MWRPPLISFRSPSVPIFLDDLNSISSKLEVITFADDASIFMSDANLAILEFQMNKELATIHNRFNCNKLKLNLQKTSFQLFTKMKNHIEPKLKISGIPIDKLQEVKFLGVLKIYFLGLIRRSVESANSDFIIWICIGGDINPERFNFLTRVNTSK